MASTSSATGDTAGAAISEPWALVRALPNGRQRLRPEIYRQYGPCAARQHRVHGTLSELATKRLVQRSFEVLGIGLCAISHLYTTYGRLQATAPNAHTGARPWKSGDGGHYHGIIVPSVSKNFPLSHWVTCPSRRRRHAASHRLPHRANASNDR